MKPTGRSLLFGTGLALAAAAWTAAARGGETFEHPFTTVTASPWLAPCECALEPLGEPEVEPEATVAWPTYYTPPAEGRPRKIKVGDVVEFRASGSYRHGVTPPDDWTFRENERDEEAYLWEPGEGAVDVTADHLAEPLPRNRRYYKFTQPGNVTVKVKYRREMDRRYTCPLRKRTLPLETCGDPVGPCPLAHAVKNVDEIVETEDESDPISYPLRVYGLELKVRRKGGGSFGESAKTAAGGLSSDVHTAEIEAKLTPAADDGDSFNFAVKLTAPHPDHRPSPGHPHGTGWMSWDAEKGYYTGSITATKDGWTCEHAGADENGAPTTVKHYYELVSPAKLGESTISGTESGVNAEATVEFAWADPEWDFEPTFTPGEYEPVSLIALDLDGEALEGHAIWVYAMQVELDSLFFDSEEWELFWDQETIDRREDDPLTRYTHFTGDPLAAAPGDGIGRAAVNGDGEITVHQWVESVAGSTDEEWEEDGLVGRVVNRVQFKAADVTVYE